MHEYSIVAALVDQVEAAARPHPTARIKRVHVAIGGGDGVVPFAFEDKTTNDSVSDYVLHPGAAMDSELRIVRQGATFTLYLPCPAEFQTHA